MRKLFLMFSAFVLISTAAVARPMVSYERVCWLNDKADRFLSESECLTLLGKWKKGCVLRGQMDPVLSEDQCDKIGGDWLWFRKNYR